MNVAEIRMLRWNCEHSSRDKIRKDIKGKLGVASMMDNMQKARQMVWACEKEEDRHFNGW